MLENARTVKMMLAAVAALGLSLTAGAANAAQFTTVMSGTACGPHQDSIHLIERNPFGIFSLNTAIGTTASVSCPIPVPAGALLNSVNLKVFDRNNGGNLIGTGFACTVYFQNGSGTTFTSNTGNLANAFSIPNMFGIGIPVVQNVWGASMECQIPNSTPSGVSPIVNYSFTYTQ
jgi:hypothetical protein